MTCLTYSGIVVSRPACLAGLWLGTVFFFKKKPPPNARIRPLTSMPLCSTAVSSIATHESAGASV